MNLVVEFIQLILTQRQFFMRLILQIGSANTLEALKNSNVIDLVLKGNPICERLRGDAYVRYTFIGSQSLMSIVLHFHFFQAYG